MTRAGSTARPSGGPGGGRAVLTERDFGLPRAALLLCRVGHPRSSCCQKGILKLGRLGSRPHGGRALGASPFSSPKKSQAPSALPAARAGPLPKPGHPEPDRRGTVAPDITAGPSAALIGDTFIWGPGLQGCPWPGLASDPYLPPPRPLPPHLSIQ